MDTSKIKLLLVLGGLAYLLGLPHALPAQDELPDPPRALRGDIHIEHYMEVAERSIRLVQDPISGHLYYNTLSGDIYRITGQGSGELMYTSDDHGVTLVQGMIFHENDLIIIGNIEVNQGRGMVGKVMRGTLQENGEREWALIAGSAEYGSMMAAFGHAWNGVAIDPEGKYLYVNSGSRTDHGEVQDNQGAYPGAREVAVTSVIFRLPIDSRDIFLPDDMEQLQARGYIFADGVRNVFDMAFSPDGHLFGVENAGDYDHPESMYWLREGHHYGFPWIMGGIKNPQQFPDWEADPEKDPFLSRFAWAVNLGLFHNDPDFPPMPEDLVITPPVQNIGPDANYFRDPETGKVIKGDRAGRAVGTFSPHRSPLGLVFDRDSVLIEEFRGDAFVIGYNGMRGGTSRAFGGTESGKQEGEDLMHVKLFYSKAYDNYIARITRIVDNFDNPTDALMIGNEMYVINHSGSGPGHIWKIILPADEMHTETD